MTLSSRLDRLEHATSSAFRDMVFTVTISAEGSSPEKRCPVTVTIDGEPVRPAAERPTSGAPWKHWGR